MLIAGVLELTQQKTKFTKNGASPTRTPGTCGGMHADAGVHVDAVGPGVHVDSRALAVTSWVPVGAVGRARLSRRAFSADLTFSF